jgi:hypothetical protein
LQAGEQYQLCRHRSHHTCAVHLRLTFFVGFSSATSSLASTLATSSDTAAVGVS